MCHITWHIRIMSLFVLFTYFYSRIQQQYTVMLHSQDCTVIVRPQWSGTVVMRHDIGRTVKHSIHLWLHGDNRKLCPVNTQSEIRLIKQRWVNDLSLVSWIKSGFSSRRGRGITWHFFHDFCTEVTTDWFSHVGWGDCILKLLLVLYLLWILSKCVIAHGVCLRIWT